MHFIFECVGSAYLRSQFLADVAAIVDVSGSDLLCWRARSPALRLNLLLGNGFPATARVAPVWRRIELRFYRFLIDLVERRKSFAP